MRIDTVQVTAVREPYTRNRNSYLGNLTNWSCNAARVLHGISPGVPSIISLRNYCDLPSRVSPGIFLDDFHRIILDVPREHSFDVSPETFLTSKDSFHCRSRDSSQRFAELILNFIPSLHSKFYQNTIGNSYRRVNIECTPNEILKGVQHKF